MHLSVIAPFCYLMPAEHSVRIVEQIFLQIVQKFCRHTVVYQEFFVQNGEKYADKAYAGGLNQRFLKIDFYRVSACVGGHADHRGGVTDR